MQLVDSHCHLDHLDLANYNDDLQQALDYADAQGVKHFLCVCITLDDFPTLLAIAERYPHVSVSVGLHPNEEAVMPSLEAMIQLTQHEKVIAIGETGLDYYRSQGELEWQRDRFRQHIQVAKQTQKPLIVHSRQAKVDTIQILKEEAADTVGGVMHCFTEDWTMAQSALDLNFYISFSGIVTFKNATIIQDVAKRLPLERMLLETDSPYLAPNPYRGKSNEPAYVRYVAEFIAELRGIDVSLLARHTTENFYTLFKEAKRD